MAVEHGYQLSDDDCISCAADSSLPFMLEGYLMKKSLRKDVEVPLW